MVKRPESVNLVYQASLLVNRPNYLLKGVTQNGLLIKNLSSVLLIVPLPLDKEHLGKVTLAKDLDILVEQTKLGHDAVSLEQVEPLPHKGDVLGQQILVVPVPDDPNAVVLGPCGGLLMLDFLDPGVLQVEVRDEGLALFL